MIKLDSVEVRGPGEFVIGGNPYAGRPAVFLSDDQYRLFGEVRMRVCMDLLFVRPDGRVLLGLRKNPPVQDWLVVGGYRVPGESRTEAAVRIAADEMGFALDPGRGRTMIGVYEYVIGEGGMVRHDETPTWRILVTDEEARAIVLSTDHFDAQRWVDPYNIVNRVGHNYHPTLIEVIRDFLALQRA